MTTPTRACLVSLLALAAAAFPGPVRAQVPGDQLRASVITFGPGPHPFSKFGHNAILIENARGEGRVYNFGMFNFGSFALLPKFLLGRYMYWLADTERDRTIAHYVAENRTVERQDLDLDAGAAAGPVRASRAQRASPEPLLPLRLLL